ncbi:MAG TPA: arginine--tRNA ligase [Chitinivibrionales bacterium]
MDSVSINDYLIKSLSDAIKAQYPEAWKNHSEIVIEKPKQKSFGDLATPVAMSLAKAMRVSPAAIARDIMSAFVWDDRYVEPDPQLNHTLAGGYINFKVSRGYLYAIMRQVVTDPASFVHVKALCPKKMLFEFVSANPTGPMVVVNGRAAAIGDVMARVNEWLGHEVRREFYVNDFGNQVELLGKSIACRYWQAKGRPGEIPEGGYEGDYIKDLARDIAEAFPEIQSMELAAMEKRFMEEALERIIAQPRSILESYGVRYDQWFRESQLHRSQAPQAALSRLREQGLTYEQDGAVWFMSSRFGDEKDRVLVRGDGSPTYFLSDLAYHVHKASRGFDESYTFWGPDHHGYIPRLEHAVNALELGQTLFKNFIIQQVNLIRNGQPFRMSKRKGDFITISELLADVSVDAARYFFLMRKLSTHFDFDMSLAVKQSEENPVFYVQYAHARTRSLLKHAEQRGLCVKDTGLASPDLLVEPEELDVMKAVADFPSVLFAAAKYVEPHRIPAYLEDLAAQFHRFYQKHRIVTDDRALSSARLMLAEGVSNTLRLGLELLGVSAPDRM